MNGKIGKQNEPHWLQRYFGKRLGALALLTLVALGLNGCAVDAGYGSGYYAPSYAGYYSDYGYAGAPYWGTGPYVGGAIVVAGRRHRGYYGRHHYAHDWRHHRRSWHHRERR